MAAARRGFLKAVAIAPLAPAAFAQTPAASPVTSPAAGPAASPGESVAEALAEAVRREHGTQLDAAAVDRVKKEIARALESASRLRAAARLQNGDEPVTVFAAVPPASERPRS